ncbi:uncharacterized protein LOC110852615 [Folsomia candida]|uniref:Enkurin n=1 Tax=Folsomia candida TaxID=158441 RepID=A0A226E5E8_FOLCA|nr:uncharacterized protein LOC110852615 [Folsomia candida]OXA51746.1 Enkurin [Folsomia candida]
MEMFGFQRYSDDLDESIYPPCDTSQTSRFRSRFAKKVRVDTWCQRTGCYNTMGPPSGCFERPKEFLRKHSRSHPVFIDPFVLRTPGADIMAQRDGKSKSDDGEKGRIRRRCGGDPPPRVERGRRDFLEENALRVIRMPHRRTKRCYNCEDGSHKMDLSTLPFVLSPGFGRVPDYLQRRKFELYCEAQRLKRETMDAQVPPNCRVMSHFERCSLISGLQSRWDELTHEYVGLPAYFSESLDKKKSELVHQLKEIEADLRLLNCSGPVFISQNSSDFPTSNFF